MLTVVPLGEDELPFSYVADAAERYPDRPALFVEGCDWTYDELLKATGALARLLFDLDLNGAGRFIALASVPSFSTYACLLGILQSGNAYLPINPRWPGSRIAQILDQSRATGLLVDAGSAQSLATALRPHVDEASSIEVPTGGATGAVYFPSRHRRDVRGDPSNAYLMYTSGSTGRPKGIAVTHDNVRFCIEALARQFPLSQDDRCVQMADLAFDFSVGEVFPCWKAGATLYVPTRGQAISPARFIREQRISIWTSVPSKVRAMRSQKELADGAFPTLRLSLFCGEVLPVSLVRDWQKAAPHTTIANLYGPTEATVFATFHIWSGTAGDRAALPIGKPLDKMKWRLDPADGHTEPSPRRGELLLSGPQVVRGYWEDPEATRSAFLLEKEGAIWYRTGDLVEHDPEVGLSFLGRVDFQVKARGYRVEIDEVARVVAAVTASEIAVVVPVLNDDGLCDCLVAFYDAPAKEEADLRTNCAELLPDFMIPRRFVHLTAFPLTVNGKVDRHSLGERARSLLR